LDVTELESRNTNRYDIEVEVPDGKYRKLENGIWAGGGEERDLFAKGIHEENEHSHPSSIHRY